MSELLDLVCAIWQCPSSEFSEHTHEDTVREADRQAREIVEMKDNILHKDRSIMALNAECSQYLKRIAELESLVDILRKEKIDLWERKRRDEDQLIAILNLCGRSVDDDAPSVVDVVKWALRRERRKGGG